MTLTLDLPQELEQELSSTAERLGIPVEQYALRLLGKRTESSSETRTGAEVVEHWKREGVIGSRPDILDSQAHSRTIRNTAERRGRV